jgi:ubiquinone/menaquinone biosynthesis C-methylase UbiE
MSQPSFDWHQRFVRQATWTKSLRDFLFSQVKLEQARQVLEVGCGTGALLAETEGRFSGRSFGLDINPQHLEQAAAHTSRSILTLGDAHTLPFSSGTFDLTFCHYLLLWVHNPLRVIQEMSRVTLPGGYILAFAEPDYGGRIDYPFELSQLGCWQQEALRVQGADPQIGRQLADLFSQVGLDAVQIGLLGGEWKGIFSEEEWISEWQVLNHDLSLLSQGWDQAQVEALQKLDRESREVKTRVLFVPTFYAVARKSN